MARCGCIGCDKVFGSLWAFDKHRTGKFDFDTRRCLTAEELKKLGFTKKDGVWRTAPNGLQR